jgi:hypothetical protein
MFKRGWSPWLGWLSFLIFAIPAAADEFAERADLPRGLIASGKDVSRCVATALLPAQKRNCRVCTELMKPECSAVTVDMGQLTEISSLQDPADIARPYSLVTDADAGGADRESPWGAENFVAFIHTGDGRPSSFDVGTETVNLFSASLGDLNTRYSFFLSCSIFAHGSFLLSPSASGVVGEFSGLAPSDVRYQNAFDRWGDRYHTMGNKSPLSRNLRLACGMATTVAASPRIADGMIYNHVVRNLGVAESFLLGLRDERSKTVPACMTSGLSEPLGTPLFDSTIIDEVNNKNAAPTHFYYEFPSPIQEVEFAQKRPRELDPSRPLDEQLPPKLPVFILNAKPAPSGFNHDLPKNPFGFQYGTAAEAFPGEDYPLPVRIALFFGVPLKDITVLRHEGTGALEYRVASGHFLRAQSSTSLASEASAFTTYISASTRGLYKLQTSLSDGFLSRIDRLAVNDISSPEKVVSSFRCIYLVADLTATWWDPTQETYHTHLVSGVSAGALLRACPRNQAPNQWSIGDLEASGDGSFSLSSDTRSLDLEKGEVRGFFPRADIKLTEERVVEELNAASTDRHYEVAEVELEYILRAGHCIQKYLYPYYVVTLASYSASGFVGKVRVEVPAIVGASPEDEQVVCPSL